jgi:hypothetical protein
LVTTSPPGTPQARAGVAGTAGVTTLFGGSNVNTDWRSGGRIRAGLWWDCEETLGTEASFFMLQDATNGFNATSDGNPILARPFFNAVKGRPDAELVAFPGIVSGTIAARETSTLLGAGFWFREHIYCGDCFSVDAVLGYRYLRLTGRLGIAENLTSTDPASKTVPLGTQLDVVDQFDASNDFHGGDLGLIGEFRRGRWSLDWRASVALGANLAFVDIDGATTVTVPGFAPLTSTGGLLALSSNRGRFERDHFAVVPEVSAKLAYQITPNLRGTVGYDFLYWTHVFRPGGQIDTTINPNLLPPVVSPQAGPLRPAPVLANTDAWIQGITVGLEYRY